MPGLRCFGILVKASIQELSWMIMLVSIRFGKSIGFSECLLTCLIQRISVLTTTPRPPSVYMTLAKTTSNYPGKPMASHSPFLVPLQTTPSKLLIRSIPIITWMEIPWVYTQIFRCNLIFVRIYGPPSRKVQVQHLTFQSRTVHGPEPQAKILMSDCLNST